MLKTIVVATAFFVVIGGVSIYLSAKPGKCEDCNQGKQCNTSYDCGEIGVCYCQYSYEEESDTGGATPDFGTCYFE